MDKGQLIENLKKVQHELADTLTQTSAKVWNEDKGEKWNTAAHAEHLLNSIKPLNQAFILPKFVFRYKFGTPNRVSRSYDELIKRYLEKLQNKTFPNGNPFGPKPNKNYSQQGLIDALNKEYEKLGNKLAKNWTEEQLENYLLPHPLLGKITIREMIMFTIYHSQHHMKAM